MSSVFDAGVKIILKKHITRISALPGSPVLTVEVSWLCVTVIFLFVRENPSFN